MPLTAVSEESWTVVVVLLAGTAKMAVSTPLEGTGSVIVVFITVPSWRAMPVSPLGVPVPVMVTFETVSGSSDAIPSRPLEDGMVMARFCTVTGPEPENMITGLEPSLVSVVGLRSDPVRLTGTEPVY
jgi:hypothetical protein